MEHLFVRDGQNLIPTKMLEQAPLKHIRLDPRVSREWHSRMHSRSVAVRPEVLHKDSLEHLTIGLADIWYSSDLKLCDRKYLARLRMLWLHLTTLESSAFQPHPPSEFFHALGQPRLELLNIKFRYDVKGSQFLDRVRAIASSCKLDNLKELAFAGGGWFRHCMECGYRPAPLVKPAELREALTSLFPLPQLKSLRISVSANFLDILDLDMYRAMAKHLQNLETLRLGHPEFAAFSLFNDTIYHERVPLHHVAAFCCLLPRLVEINVGTVDGLLLEVEPRADWTCPQVKKASWNWAGRADGGSGGVSRQHSQKCIRTYFPESDMARGFTEDLWVFDDS